ncbi:MAG: tetratricopeptide repeat protein, partial [Propionivibrio sp.]
MRPIFHTPVLARLSAIVAGLVLSLSVAFASAQSLVDIQRLMKQDQMPQALEQADVYVAANPKDAQGRFLRGLILTEMSRQADAIAVFAKLTEDFPELPEPYNNLAVLYAQQKQYDKARTALEMASRTHPSYAIAQENLGDVYAKLASQAYDKALKLDSSNTATQTKLSMIKELIGNSSNSGVAPPAPPARVAPAPASVVVAKPVPTPPAPVAESAAPVAAPAKPAAPPPEPKVVAKATEKPVAEKQPVAASKDADVRNAVLGWADAWSRKDIKAYLGYYA